VGRICVERLQGCRRLLDPGDCDDLPCRRASSAAPTSRRCERCRTRLRPTEPHTRAARNGRHCAPGLRTVPAADRFQYCSEHPQRACARNRWPLLFTFVAILAGLRFPLSRRRCTSDGGARTGTVSPGRAGHAADYIAFWTMPAVIGFILVYPLLAMLIAGPRRRQVDRQFRHPDPHYVLLGWGSTSCRARGPARPWLCRLYCHRRLHLRTPGQVSSTCRSDACLPLAAYWPRFWGVLLGFPVLRLRGDYLAVVTLAFGEIIRLVLINWKDVTQGSAGIGGLPRPTFLRPCRSTPHPMASRRGWDSSSRRCTARCFLYYVVLAVVRAHRDRHRSAAPAAGRARLGSVAARNEIACRSLGINTPRQARGLCQRRLLRRPCRGPLHRAARLYQSGIGELLRIGADLAIRGAGRHGSTVGVAIARRYHRRHRVCCASTTIARISARFGEVHRFRTDKALPRGEEGPCKAAEEAPLAKAASLALVVLIPSERQAISSSRNASQARPTGSGAAVR